MTLPQAELLLCPKIMPLRFMFKVKFEGNCWIWTGAKNNKGYGHLGINGKTILAHRFSYSFHYGGIPEGMTLDHQCRNKLCVNPYHLKPMTQKENSALGFSPPAINKRKKFCIRGHKLEGKHISIEKDTDCVRRRCRLCDAINSKNHYYRKKSRHEEKNVVIKHKCYIHDCQGDVILKQGEDWTCEKHVKFGDKQ